MMCRWCLGRVSVMCSDCVVMFWWYVGDALVLCWWCLCSVSVMLWCLSDGWWCCGDRDDIVMFRWWILMNILRFSVGSEEKRVAVRGVFAIGVVCWANFVFFRKKSDGKNGGKCHFDFFVPLAKNFQGSKASLKRPKRGRQNEAPESMRCQSHGNAMVTRPWKFSNDFL